MLWHQRISALAHVLASLPSIVLAGMLVARLGGLMGSWGMVVLLGVWLLSGVPVLLFFLAVESGRPDVREPEWTPAQASRLVPAWRDVVEAAGVCADDYVVLIDKSKKVSGYARDGWTIGVTSGAVRNLRRPQLSALLAHELGHLFSSHRSSIRIAALWYAAPLYLPALLVSLIVAMPTAVLDSGVLSKLCEFVATVAHLATTAGVLILLLGTRHALVAAALLAAQVLAKQMIRRRNERKADLVAVDLGFGAGLAALLREDGREPCFHPAELPWVERLSRFVFGPLSTHPSTRRRIRTIESRMRARGEPTV
ncbi:M48 family metalloprotease [Nocardia sp. NPDC050406]|uniref:M48 family metalloprotease n=1 Tax=Nocardia sp. NPDC050406 TaxID=3364318 RepID=UPI0037BD5E83